MVVVMVVVVEVVVQKNIRTAAQYRKMQNVSPEFTQKRVSNCENNQYNIKYEKRTRLLLRQVQLLVSAEVRRGHTGIDIVCGRLCVCIDTHIERVKSRWCRQVTTSRSKNRCAWL